MLVAVDEADAVLVDRWTILLDAQEAGGGENGLTDLEPPKVPWGGCGPGWGSPDQGGTVLGPEQLAPLRGLTQGVGLGPLRGLRVQVLISLRRLGVQVLASPCTQVVQMSNYCGIGIDAELSLDFHQAREEEPGKFTSRCRGIPQKHGPWGAAEGCSHDWRVPAGSITRACMCGLGCRR